MPSLSAVSTISFPDKIRQELVKQEVLGIFSGRFPHAERLIGAFDNTGIETRNFCMPLDYYREPHTFERRNNDYLQVAVDYCEQAAGTVLRRAGLKKEQVTDVVLVSTTGLATPSLDALLINRMKLKTDVRRTPVWGLGCAGGVSGLAKAFLFAKSDPDAVVLFISVELCSLTLIKSDYSKSNFIGSSLFSDGIAAVLVLGDNHPSAGKPVFKAAASRLYYDSLDVMGWDFRDDGFKVLFSKDIPAIISEHVRGDLEKFLSVNDLTLDDVENFIFHPGGKKVIDAYLEALGIPVDSLAYSVEVMTENGNMSSATVLYVLEKYMHQAAFTGPSLMMAMGPGFSCEMLLLH